eukprot:gene10904-12063_t
MGLANNTDLSISSQICHVRKTGICRKRSSSGSNYLQGIGRAIHNPVKGKLLEGLLVKSGKTCLPEEDIRRIQKLVDDKIVYRQKHSHSLPTQNVDDKERAKKQAILEYLTSGFERVRIKSETEAFGSIKCQQPPVDYEVTIEPTPMADVSQCGMDQNVVVNTNAITPLSELERMKLRLPAVQSEIPPSPAMSLGPMSPANSDSSSSSRESEEESGGSRKPLTLYNGTGQILLWQFLIQCLAMGEHGITWTNRNAYEFKFTQPDAIARSWGRRKNKTTMTYEKMSRSLRTYYKRMIMTKVHDRRHTFKFLPKVHDICRQAMQM